MKAEEIEALGEWIKPGFAAIAKNFSALQKRVDALEAAAKESKFCGVWQRARADEYKKNNFITFNSSLWVALKDAPGAPDVDHEGWQLCAKGAVR